MARSFDDASSEYLARTGGAPASAVPITLACFLDIDDITASRYAMALGDANDADQLFFMGVSSSGVNPVFAGTKEGAGQQSTAVSTAGISTNTWHHACAVYAAVDDRRAFLDGGNKGTEGTSRTPSGIDGTWVAASSQPAGYTSGSLAEVAIWNIALTDAEVAILALGYSPLFVRPQNLVAYWPLIRDEDQDRVGGYDLTPYNTPTIAPHPRVFYPAPRHITLASKGAAGLGLGPVSATASLASSGILGAASLASAGVSASVSRREVTATAST